MSGARGAVSRRAALRGLALLAGLGVLPGCATEGFADTRLRLGTGPTDGGYFALGTALARAWQRELALSTAPEVLPTKGSIDNLRLLLGGGAELVFCQVDVAADRLTQAAPDGSGAPRALARLYDGVVQVVTTARSPVRSLFELRGSRVSLGDPESGVNFLARRLLQMAALVPERDLVPMSLGIADSAAALLAGRIDAFFWTGALPSQVISTLAEQQPIRLIDLSGVVGPICAKHPEYAPGTVPASSYAIPLPVASLLVRNVLLVNASLPDDLAAALTSTIFTAQGELAAASRAASTIDPRAAIGTQPVLLHPGAETFYRRKATF